MPYAVSVVEMVCARVVKIDREFDEPQPQQPDIEIDVRLRMAGDGGDVVDAEDLFGHRR